MSKTAMTRTTTALSLAALASLAGCGPESAPSPSELLAQGRERAASPDPEPTGAQDGVGNEYPGLDPASAELLVPLRFVEPDGPGYARVKAKLEDPLYAAPRDTPWLSLAGGGRTFGPHHLIVHHHKRRPKPYGQTKPDFSALLDLRSGELTASFTRILDARWDHGLALVRVPDDERPHLLDASTGALVPAVPKAEGYAFGDNFWVRLSPADARVWIYARAREGAPVYLQEWTALDRPPPAPDAEFPFFPHTWDPPTLNEYRQTSSADSLEVWPRAPEDEPLECGSAILDGPRSYRCARWDTVPLAQGWRLDYTDNFVYHPEQGLGFDLDSLCPASEEAIPHRMGRSPARVSVTCEEDPSRWFEWTPEGLRVLSAEDARAVDGGRLHLLYQSYVDAYELVKSRDHSGFAMLDRSGGTELIAANFSCDNTSRVPGTKDFFAIRCLDDAGHPLWVELISRSGKVRARTKVADMAISPQRHTWALTRSDGRDHLSALSLPPR